MKRLEMAESLVGEKSTIVLKTFFIPPSLARDFDALKFKLKRHWFSHFSLGGASFDLKCCLFFLLCCFKVGFANLDSVHVFFS